MATDYTTKIANGTITVREAFQAVLAKKLTDSNRENIEGLYKALSKEGVDLDARYFDVYNTKEFAEAFDYSTNKTGVHRYKEFGAFETQFKGLVDTSGRNLPYNKLSGGSGIAKTKFGLTGIQIRVSDPMRGTVSSESLDQIYKEAFAKDSYTVIDTKTGKEKTIIIDSEARDYLIYEKYTGQRVESNIGPDGLKISDINFFTDENDQIVAEVRAKQVANKTRPEATYTGEFAEFLRNKVERAKANLPADTDFNNVNLFQTTPDKVTSLWNATIRPKLEAKHSNQLPAGKQGSHSSIRKILARQLRAEFKFSHDAVKAWMGHAGIGVDSNGDILTENYTGAIADDRIGGMTNVLIQNDARNSGFASVNLMFNNRGIPYSQEITFPTPSKKVTANTYNVANPPNTGTPMTEGELNERNAAANLRAVELEIATENRRQYLSSIRSQTTTTTEPKTSSVDPNAETPTINPEASSALKEKGFDAKGAADAFSQFFKGGKNKLNAALAITTGGLTVSQFIEDASAAARDIAIEGLATAAKLGPKVGGAIPMIVTPSNVQVEKSGRPVGAMYSPEELRAMEMGRIATEDAGMDMFPGIDEREMERIATQDTGFVDIDRAPEAAPVDKDQGFLSR